MPKLPDFTSVGQTDYQGGARPAVKLDLSGVGEGMAAFGKGMKGLGDDVFRVARNENNQQQEDEDAKARSEFSRLKSDLDTRYADDQEWWSWEGRYEKDLQKLKADTGALITDPRRRERFNLSVDPVIAAAQSRMFGRLKEKTTDIYRAELGADLPKIMQSGLKAEAEEEKQFAIEAAQARIQAAVNRGILDAETGGRMQRDWVSRYADGTLLAMQPEERIKALSGPVPKEARARAQMAVDFFVSRGWSPHAAAGIVGNLYEESNQLNPSARNPEDGKDGSDSIGLGQWNAGRAVALKRFAADRGLDWRSFNVQLEFVDHELRTSEAAAGERLKAAKSPREAAEAMITYERPAGSQKGVRFAHNYHGRVQRSEEFAGLTPKNAKFAEYIPEERKRGILRDAYAEIRQREVADAQQRRLDQAEIKSLIEDDFASIGSTGKPVEALTRERVAAIYGEDVATQWEQARGRAQQYYGAISQFPKMTAEEILAEVERVRPKGGQPGFADAQKQFGAVTTAANEQLKTLGKEQKERDDSFKEFRKPFDEWSKADAKEREKESEKGFKEIQGWLKDWRSGLDKSAKSQNQRRVKGMITDDVSSVERAGVPLAELNRQMVVDAFDEERADDWERARANALKLFNAKQTLRETPTGDLSGVLDRFRPQPGWVGYNDEAETFDKIAAEAKRIADLRLNDPAASVAEDPAVAEAQKAVNVNPADPQAWRALVGARMKAQRAIGIPETSLAPITNDEGVKLMDPVLEAPAGQEVIALRAVAKRFDEMFGPDAGRAFTVAIGSAGVDKQTREVAGALLRKLGLGKPVAPADLQKLEDAKAEEPQKKAVAPVMTPPIDPTQSEMGGFMPPGFNDPLPPPSPKSETPDRQDARITPKDRQLLISEPTPQRMMQFDKVYGKGAAKRILEATGNAGKVPK
jgi:hypothetical protein